MQRGIASELQRNILRTLSYADIFDYPLTPEEIVKFLVGESEVEMEVVLNALAKVITDPKQVCTDGEFYFLRGRKEIVELRKKRMRWSEKKWGIAQKTVNGLRIIPLIKMIGITGALAMNNCWEEDDIDLLVITSANCLWLTRLVIFLLIPLLGIRRRKPQETEVKDKICFNLFLEENHLQIKTENLFLAHEICQVKPLLNRGKTYEKFLGENQWVSNFLPNAKNSSKFKSLPRACRGVQNSKFGRNHSISQYLNILISFLDIIAFKLQYFYMKPKKTNERITLHQAFFHPQNLQEKTQAEYEKRIGT